MGCSIVPADDLYLTSWNVLFYSFYFTVNQVLASPANKTNGTKQQFYSSPTTNAHVHVTETISSIFVV